MLSQFSRLSASEYEVLMKSPFLVCILIAGADNDIDKREIKKAIDLTNKKQKKSKSALLAFYQEVGQDFEDKLKVVLQNFPLDKEERTHLLTQELTQVNIVLSKIEKTLAIEFYNSIRELASEVARSSGGLLGLNSVGKEEAELLELSMIKNPSTY